jgi:hypothetical protein
MFEFEIYIKAADLIGAAVVASILRSFYVICNKHAPFDWQDIRSWFGFFLLPPAATVFAVILTLDGKVACIDCYNLGQAALLGLGGVEVASFLASVAKERAGSAPTEQ